MSPSLQDTVVTPAGSPSHNPRSILLILMRQVVERICVRRVQRRSLRRLVCLELVVAVVESVSRLQ